MEVERSNYFREDSDCKDICDTDIHVYKIFEIVRALSLVDRCV